MSERRTLESLARLPAGEVMRLFEAGTLPIAADLVDWKRCLHRHGP